MPANLKEMMARARERVLDWMKSNPTSDLEKYLVLKGAKSPADVEHWIREYTYKDRNSLV